MIIGPKVHWKGGSGTLFSISWRVSCLVFQPLLQDVAQTNSPASLWSAGNSASLRKGHWRNQCGWTEVTRLRQENAFCASNLEISRVILIVWNSIPRKDFEKLQSSLKEWYWGVGQADPHFPSHQCKRPSLEPGIEYDSVDTCRMQHCQYALIDLNPSARSYMLEKPKCANDGRFQWCYSTIGWANFMTSLVRCMAARASMTNRFELRRKCTFILKSSFI